MSQSEYEDDFREWFEQQLKDEATNAAMVEAVYRPMYTAYLAGAARAAQAITEAIKEQAS